MNLSQLSDEALLSGTKVLVTEENKVRSSLLRHLAEIDRRRLFADLGYSSLFSYVVKELKYSESAAYRRIQAARMLNHVPDLVEKVEKGSLSLGNISQASRFFKENKITGNEAKKNILKRLENKSRKDGEKTLFALAGNSEIPKKETIRRNSNRSHELKFTLGEETFAKLDELKGLLAHRRKRRLEEVFDYAIAAGVRQAKKEKFGLEPQAQRKSKTITQTRYIPAQVKRKVYYKSAGKCSNCGSAYKLEFDHIKPFSYGGETSEKNLRLLCFSCNQRQRIKAGLRGAPARTR